MTDPQPESMTLETPASAPPDFRPFDRLASEQAALEWARCRDWIKRASDESAGETLASIEESIEAGRCFFWAGPDCAAITRFEEYPNNVRDLTVVYVGGNLETAVAKGLPALELFAKQTGCTGITVLMGENEMVANLKAIGFGVSLISLTKPISREVH
jgi:hypothetical protein